MKEKIKSFFQTNQNTLITSKALSKRLSVKKKDVDFYKQELYRLFKEGYLIKSGKRYRLNKASAKKFIGELQLVNENNYGFVIFKNKKLDDVFISERHLNNAMDGDKVEVSLFAKRSGKNQEGQIINVVKRKHEEIVGILRKSNSFFYVEPDDSKIHRKIYISSKNLKNATEGDKVVVSKIAWETSQPNPEGVIMEVLGKAGSYDAEIASIAREFGIRYKFSKGVLSESEEFTAAISETEIKNRLDLRDKNIFTIDPKTAKDFDDAVSVEKLPNNNLLIGIHIADVSHYVTPGSKIFKEAEKRGTSVYLVGKVIPMLPERISNNLCSLVPNEDRLTFSVIVEFTPEGKQVDYKIAKTIINSKRRFTYEEVQEIIEKQNGEHCNDILKLNSIAKILRKARTERGSINFSTPDVEFDLDTNGVPIDIKIKESNESHRLIEEFMLLANRIVSAHVNKKKKQLEKYPFVYRIHDLPNEEKINEFAKFVQSLGYFFTPDIKGGAKELQRILEEVEGTEEEAVVNEIAIRSMAKAIYSTQNIGHYGLGFNYYSHFTSPIRRFPDLITHLLIFNFISDNKGKSFNYKRLEEICEHSSAMERNAIMAERLSIKLKQIEYLKNKVGEKFKGVISGLTHFGIFVELNSNLAEGLIHLSDLDDDFYVLDEKSYSMVGSETEKQFRLGDKIEVQLKSVNEEKREIDFILSN
ncbi:MAG: ribonuclease R [Ignavibacteriae bacterium]|nr:MAG: ribonuclease R [Ignavibacteriota bacterium]